MGHAVAARGLQHRQVAGQVGALIGERILDRVAHARLGGQVHDPLGAAFADQGLERLRVGDVHPDHGEAGPLFQPPGPRRLQGGVVVVVEGVDPDALAAVQQAMGDVGSDESRRRR